MIRIFILCIGLTFRVCAQAVYQGPNPESLAATSSEKAFLADFTEKFKTDFDTTTQYAKARTTPVDGWEMALFQARKEQMAFYRAAAPGGSFSEPFRNYIEACIRWNYWHLLLAQPVLRGRPQQTVSALPAVMLDGFEELKVSDEAALPTEPYRNFLVHYVAYFSAKDRRFAPYRTADLPGRLSDQAEFARQHLSGRPYQYTLARLLIMHCAEARPSAVREWAGALGALPGSAAYASRVREHCGAAMARKDEPEKEPVARRKTPDPQSFFFTNLSGEPVTFEAFRGKVVYLDVWASWCGPCRAEFPFSKQLHERLDKKQKERVVFLYISIDDTEAVWKNALNALKLPGEQGWSAGGWNSKVIQHFGIQGIPRYVLIDKQGRVVDANAKRPSSGDAIWQEILTLLNP